MKNIVTIILGVLVNFIIYYSAGTIVLCSSRPIGRMRGSKGHGDKITTILNRIVVGFFAYYALFFFFCVPVMKLYRPLSMLTRIWTVVVALMVICAVILNISETGNRAETEKAEGAIRPEPEQLSGSSDKTGFVKEQAVCAQGNREDTNYAGKVLPAAGILLLVLLQVILVSCTYNFTLDAAYYVAGVATNVDTNMINVYDPFTGAWQDHFEMRYFFATYSVQDAVVCQLTGISPLVWTKTVMAAVIIILTNMVYFLIARELLYGGRFGAYGKASAEGQSEGGSGGQVGEASAEGQSGGGRKEQSLWPVFGMLLVMFGVNVTFNTIYTSSLFLMTRTYEGKAIVGNLAVVTIFYLFLLMSGTAAKERLINQRFPNNTDGVSGKQPGQEAGQTEEGGVIRPWLSVFLVCFGASTISSTANMLMPVEVTVLFMPYIFRTKSFRMLPKYAACVVPGVVFSLLFVLYVKGYFVFYTFPK
ncbi:MAG: hypothetical protein IJ073_04755 [Lachnospiraceae bacterium]|nr:hypothetical protein [Lachnospiraceae bacterium]